MSTPVIRILSENEWPIFRDFRLRALENSPEHIGGVIEEERAWDESQWRAQLKKFDFVLATVEGDTVGGMTVEKLKGDFGATCWIGSCWIDPTMRGKKIFSTMIAFLDSVAEKKGWLVQGLGVWVDNHAAIPVYEKLGFEKKGPEMPSTRVTNPQKFYQRMIRETPKERRSYTYCRM